VFWLCLWEKNTTYTMHHKSAVTSYIYRISHVSCILIAWSEQMYTVRVRIEGEKIQGVGEEITWHVVMPAGVSDLQATLIH
jgi:hypothetical protein